MQKRSLCGSPAYTLVHHGTTNCRPGGRTLQPTRWGRDVVSLGRLTMLDQKGKVSRQAPWVVAVYAAIGKSTLACYHGGYLCGLPRRQGRERSRSAVGSPVYVLTERTWVSKCSCPSDQYKMGMPFAVNAARPRLLHSSPSLKLLTIPAIRCCWSQDAVRTSRGRPGRQCCPRCRWSSLPLYP